MIGIESDELARHPEWPRVLSLYERLHDEARQRSPEHSGWLDRVLVVEGVAQDRLARIHGRLIAAGFLNIQLTDRAAGLQYQVSGEGRRALAGQHLMDDEVA